MTFRTRILLIFTLAVVASVGLVEWLVLVNTRHAFERLEAQRVGALVSQFQKEFDRRRAETAAAIESLAQSDVVTSIAISADPAASYGEAAALAHTRGLDLLELVAADGAIVSSAEWPARFGYHEDWLLAARDWKALGGFLRRAELPDGFVLALAAVRVVNVLDHKLYVTGGHTLDREFLDSLVLPAGMRAMLYRNLEAQQSLLGGEPADQTRLNPLIEEVRKTRHEVSATIGTGAASETFYALPLLGYENNLLGALLVGSSRRALVELESSLRTIGAWVAAAGILVGMILSWWATARITRPVRRLAESAGLVAEGKWGTTVETTSNDEIGQLANAFNHMTQELVQQRERLVQSERVAAWRELARRLAHELKNPLFPMQITVENMQRAKSSYPAQFEEVFREGTATLLAELSNLKQIIGRFSDFAKMPTPEMQPVSFNDLAEETLKLFGPQLAEGRIAAEVDLDSNLPAVQADPEQLTRVLRNLILNAIDAMPHGGTLTIRTRALPHGARVEVSDTGTGLTREECERLFTPYYTTKTHGTGLGLAIVQSVVSDHGGRISVESEPGKGTTFRIELG